MENWRRETSGVVSGLGCLKIKLPEYVHKDIYMSVLSAA